VFCDSQDHKKGNFNFVWLPVIGSKFIDFSRHINRPPVAGFIQTRSGFAAFLLRLYGA